MATLTPKTYLAVKGSLERANLTLAAIQLTGASPYKLAPIREAITTAVMLLKETFPEEDKLAEEILEARRSTERQQIIKQAERLPTEELEKLAVNLRALIESSRY